jgi:hypothetical protein
VIDVHRFPIEEEEYVEFSKLTQDLIIGTKGEIATVSLSRNTSANSVLLDSIIIQFPYWIQDDTAAVQNSFARWRQSRICCHLPSFSEL